MDKIEELRGIILGINYDGVINNLEVKELNDWLDKNRSLSLNDEYKTLIRDIEDVLEKYGCNINACSWMICDNKIESITELNND